MLHRVATKEREEIKGTTMEKMARRHSKGANHQEQESNRQRTVEGTDGGLHPAVYGQSLGERWNRKAIDRRQWKALMDSTSCSGWTNFQSLGERWNRKATDKTMEGIDGGLHPAVYGQSLGERWNRKAIDRRQWKALMEGYVLQWMDSLGERWKV